MEEGFLIKAGKWWQEHVLSLPENDNKKKPKVAKVKLKRKFSDEVQQKELKATLKTLNGPYGRMDRKHYDDIQ